MSVHIALCKTENNLHFTVHASVLATKLEKKQEFVFPILMREH